MTAPDHRRRGWITIAAVSVGGITLLLLVGSFFQGSSAATWLLPRRRMRADSELTLGEAHDGSRWGVSGFSGRPAREPRPCTACLWRP
jgi:hypothetical protein